MKRDEHGRRLVSGATYQPLKSYPRIASPEIMDRSNGSPSLLRTPPIFITGLLRRLKCQAHSPYPCSSKIRLQQIMVSLKLQSFVYTCAALALAAKNGPTQLTDGYYVISPVGGWGEIPLLAGSLLQSGVSTPVRGLPATQTYSPVRLKITSKFTSRLKQISSVA